jgi:hypothetical protein
MDNPLANVVAAMYHHSLQDPHITVRGVEIRPDDMRPYGLTETFLELLSFVPGQPINGPIVFSPNEDTNQRIRHALYTVYHRVMKHLEQVGPDNIGLLTKFQFNQDVMSDYRDLLEWDVYGVFEFFVYVPGNQEAMIEGTEIVFYVRDDHRIVIESQGRNPYMVEGMLNIFMLSFLQATLGQEGVTPIKRMKRG